jgi:hypothetical protein
MNRQVSISREEMERKYHEGHWEEKLPSLLLEAKEIEYSENPSDSGEITRRRTETYKDQGRKVLQRCFITKGDVTTMSLTFLSEDGVAYFVKRIT